MWCKKNEIKKEVLSQLYHITKSGDVIRRSDGHIFTPTKDNKGYFRVRLPYPDAPTSDGRYQFKVHRLVAMFYLEDYSESLQVNHINGIKTDNNYSNLEMVTNKENVLHAWRVLDSSSRRKKVAENNKKRVYERKNVYSTQL